MAGRVLCVASEAVPLVKTGGLADVVGALPRALAAQGWEMRVLLPLYRSLRGQYAHWPVVWQSADLWGGPAQVRTGEVAGVQFLLLDAPHLFDRDGGPYAGSGGDFGDNALRFGALSWVGAVLAREGVAGWHPDILHAHDWQAGLAPAYLRYGPVSPVRSVITIHNMAFQGWAEAQMLGPLQLPLAEFHADALEYYGGLSSLKAGLVTADHITTVSPRYAQELMRPEFGLGLEGVIEARAAAVSGILNGIDTEIWSPEREPQHGYSAKSLSAKNQARQALLQEFGLSVPGPLAILVSRLTDQKGIDLIPEALAPFIEGGGGLAVLGSGAPELEAAMQALALRYPGRVGLRIGYDEGLSHRMFQGGDAVLVPSRFEPCGLTQSYGLRYGTLPVVAAVGGLADTVIGDTPASRAAGVATGVTFWPVDALALRRALQQLLALYGQPKLWARMQKNAMAQDLGWGQSAAAYAAVYAELRE